MTIAAWGTHGNYLNRGEEVSTNAEKSLLFKKNKKMTSPSHPLYLPANLKPIKYP